MDVHLGQSQVERPFGARSLFQCGKIKAAAAHPGGAKALFAEAGHHGLGLETVGLVGAFRRPLMGAQHQKSQNQIKYNF